MAVMSPQPSLSAPENKVSSAAPTPASAGAGSMVSQEATAMDLDHFGSKSNDTSSVCPPSSPREDDKTSVPFVNGNKGVTAPPSPPIPTPPLRYTSSDNGQELSDLHITSPDGLIMRTGNFEIGGDKASDETKSDSQPVKTEATSSPSPTAAEENDHAMEDAPLRKSGREREEDEDGNDEDRPNKRAKTEDTAESEPAAVSASTTNQYTGPLTPARVKFVLTVIRSLRRSKDGRPFSMPVDAVKLNIPTYYELITKPMDLQTMERKLNNNEYADLDGFMDDFKQILWNCLTFNGADNPVTAMSRSMEASFYRHMKDIPSEAVVDVEKQKPKKKGHVLSGAAAASHQNKASGASKTTGKQAHRKEPKPSAQSPPAPSPVFSLQPSGMPQIRRDSTAGDGRPKREIHPPAPKDLPYSTKPRRKQNAAELKFCDSVLKELLRKAHEGYAFPFYHPVDPVALNIPEYFKVIKRPMDLHTIGEKLKMNAYENANEFEEDMRLMFNNCYKFNPVGQAVHQMGRQLEQVFDLKWKDKPLYTNPGSRSPQSASPPPLDDEDMSEEEDSQQPNIADLEKQLEKMKEEISSLKRKKKTPPAQAKSHKSKAQQAAAGGRKQSGGNQSTNSKKSSGKPKKDVPYISLEQKTELSERINLLPPKKMHYALVMIKEMMPELGNDGAEIELDIDELDPHTLHKLYKYVSKNAPEIAKPYVPPPPPPPVQTYEPMPKAKPGVKGRKNKPMSAAEQEAKIKDIESRLHSFEKPAAAFTPAAPAPANNDDSDSSGDDESSASESEEE